jgi:phosphoribosylformimino-5-aminoimidazole carboxamide ribotide isomerase
VIIFPAIDLRRGQVVRLRQGDPAAQTTYGEDPTEVARRWAAQGAEWLHVVNLDGALGDATEMPLNLRRLAEIRAAVELPIQFGGGLRSLGDLDRAFTLGATRAVLGTAAVRDPELLREALAEFGPERIVAGIDARDGQVATHGWRETSGVDAPSLARQMRAIGVLRAVYTDIARDGMLAGPNVRATAQLARDSGMRLIASGGVAGIADIYALAEHESGGIEGVIVGQALYGGALALPEAIAAGRPREGA